MQSRLYNIFNSKVTKIYVSFFLEESHNNKFQMFEISRIFFSDRFRMKIKSVVNLKFLQTFIKLLLYFRAVEAYVNCNYDFNGKLVQNEILVHRLKKHFFLFFSLCCIAMYF